ncbi:transcriptional regulator [Candidatus Nitrospira inopinata]|nr:transcriptional regulator [Candidatus Nitrospira inopinata]
MVFASPLTYHAPMLLPERLPPERTVRRRIIELLADTRLSSYQLAQRLGIPERQVEEHLPHIVKSLARDRTRRFVLEPASCFECGFVFRERRRLTRPGRCPACRSEGVSAPRYGIDSIKGRTGTSGQSRSK